MERENRFDLKAIIGAFDIKPGMLVQHVDDQASLGLVVNIQPFPHVPDIINVIWAKKPRGLREALRDNIERSINDAVSYILFEERSMVNVHTTIVNVMLKFEKQGQVHEFSVSDFSMNQSDLFFTCDVDFRYGNKHELLVVQFNVW